MYKKVLVVFVVLSLFLLKGCRTGPEEFGKPKEIILKAANIHPEEYPTTQGTKYLAKLLEERSNGRIRLQVYADGQLGQGKPIEDAIRDGIIDIDREGLDVYTAVIPMTEAFIMPFVFRDAQHVQKVLAGPIGQRLAQEFEKKDIIVLGYYAAGARSFYTAKPVATPEDIRGMKIRVLPTELFKNMVQTLGATGIQILYNEVYPQLQIGAVGGAENSPPSYLTSRHYELAPYYVLDEHLFIPEILYVSKRTWNSLHPEDQKLLKECGAEAAKYQRDLWMDFEIKSIWELKRKGVKIVRPDKEGFRKAMEPLYEQYPQHKALIQEIQAIN